MDPREIERFQMVGQDLPHLLDEWVASQPDTPLLVWEPRDGASRTWTYREFRDDTLRIAAGLLDRGYQERDKDLLKVGGENVSARQVEETCREVGGISDIAVVGQSHEMLDQVPVVFVIRAADAPGDEDEHARAIIDRCAQRLADFKVPRAVHFVDEFPRATLDKVAKNKLRELAEDLGEG